MKISLALLVALLGGCSAAPQSIDICDMNVILIVVDTMGADTGEWTPSINALAAGGINYTRAYAASSWTQPSVASLFTGLTPSEHRVMHIRDKLDQRRTTLATLLRNHGYSTSGVVSHYLLDEAHGYAQGFDRFNSDAVRGWFESSSAHVNEQAVSELRRLSEEKFFLFVHYFDPHNAYLHHARHDMTAWYDGPARKWTGSMQELTARRILMDANDIDYLRGLYREEIAYTDRHIGKLLAELESLGLTENTLVVLTADHGEEFMEHAWMGHTRHLYNATIHVPLIFSLPGSLRPATRDHPISLIDVLPLIFGAEVDEGKPVFSEVSFRSPPAEVGTVDGEKESFKTSVICGDWKLIHDLETERWDLFCLEDDPGEHYSLAGHPKMAEMRGLLQSWERGKTDTWGQGFAVQDTLSDKERDLLRSLGYVR